MKKIDPLNSHGSWRNRSINHNIILTSKVSPCENSCALLIAFLPYIPPSSTASASLFFNAELIPVAVPLFRRTYERPAHLRLETLRNPNSCTCGRHPYAPLNLPGIAPSACFDFFFAHNPRILCPPALATSFPPVNFSFQILKMAGENKVRLVSSP